MDDMFITEVKTKMKQNLLLYLVQCGLQGQIYEDEEKIKLLMPYKKKEEWMIMYQQAQQMRVESFFIYGMQKAYGYLPPLGQEQARQWYGKELTDALGRVILAQEVHDLQQTLRQMGIPTALLKGLAVGSTYAYPELRGGCDVDLYVDEMHEQRVYAYARSIRCKVHPRVKGTHHGEILHPIIGLIELHVRLANADQELIETERAGDVPLVKPVRNFTEVSYKEITLVTLDSTEHMLYLISHMVNHYLHGEETLRQMADCNSFYEVYGEKMDRDYLWSQLEQLRYHKIFLATLIIGNQYLGYKHDLPMILEKYLDLTESLKQLETLAEELLQDFCGEGLDRQEAIYIYDCYSNSSVAGGKAGLTLKMRVLASNIRTAVQLWHKMSKREIFRMGVDRVYNLFGSGSDREHGDAVQRRCQCMMNAGLLEKE